MKESQPTNYFSNANLAAIARQSAIPIVLTDREGTILFASESFYEFFEIEPGSREKGIVKNLFVDEESWIQITTQCLKEGAWDNYDIVKKSKDEELVVKLTGKCLKKIDGHPPVLSLQFSETNEARQRIYKQGQLLKATSFCANILINSDQFKESLDEVVSRIGKSVSADRCYIYEKTYLPDSEETYANLVAQWNRKGLPDNTEDISFLSFSIFPEFLETLKASEIYERLISQFEGRTKQLLTQRLTKSMICIPIFKEEDLWGFLGFDDCKTERIWDEEDKASLQLLANTLSAIINRKQLRDELQKKNEQLESAILGSKDSLWDYDVQKERIYYSPQFLDLLGYQKSELSGTQADLANIIHSHDISKIFNRLNYLLQGGEDILDRELRMVHKNGSLIWVKVTAKAQKDLSGKVIRIAGSNTDITLEKTYQIQIDESENKYYLLVENLRETVFQLNRQGNTEFLSKAWTNLSGHSTKQSLGKPLESYMHEGEQEEYSRMIEELFENPQAYKSMVVRIIGKGGQEKWTEIYARSMHLTEKEPYILGTIIDITKRRSAETKLKESEEKYRLISENFTDLVCLQDRERRFLFVSPSMKNILGYCAEEMLGKTPEEVFGTTIHTKNNPWGKDSWLKTDTVSYPMKTVNGNKIWLETVKTKIGDPEDDSFILQSATKDITVYKEAEQSLQKALAKQQELNDLKSDFISMASHEFRTPLTTIRSSVQLLEEYSKELSEEKRTKSKKHYERIKTQIERVTRLMNDVLILGRFDAGKAIFEPKRINFNQFVEDLIHEHFSAQEDGREIQLEILGKPTDLSIDASLMTHVILNLVSNAFKYSTGKANPELSIDFNPEKQVVLTVRDYGIGIPLADREKIFQSFFRSKNAISIPGTGLGLVITKEIVQLHKGNIQIDSILDEKTDVIITLPKK